MLNAMSMVAYMQYIHQRHQEVHPIVFVRPIVFVWPQSRAAASACPARPALPASQAPEQAMNQILLHLAYMLKSLKWLYGSGGESIRVVGFWLLEGLLVLEMPFKKP